ncbi:MAG: hypothetical protein DWH79_10680 [Planctomycetota bacterium]|nr:MAG: hypothetical protein DWH79_10680 [Planctomycetota bacterium]
MPTAPSPPSPATVGSGRPARRGVSVWLAGPIGLDAWGAMSERLAWDVSEPGGRPPTLVICELERSITVGRLGSRRDIDLTEEELTQRRLRVRFTGRGGGAILHGPGQIHVALFATLEDLGLARHDVGGCIERMEAGLEGTIRRLRCGAARDSGCHGVFGRTGLLAAVGMAVRRGVVSHGAWLNVTRTADVYSTSDIAHRVRTATGSARGAVSMSSVEVDVQRRVRLQDARAAIVEQFVDAYAFPASHIQAGFPLPVRTGGDSREVFSRVG